MESTMTVTGYVGHNIELKQTRTGVSTVSFRVGTTPRIKTDNGWVDQATTWLNVVCYRSLADHVAGSVYKGDPVIVHGKVRTQAWIDAQGVQHEKMVIEAAAVGHDLTRGVSVFKRSPVRAPDGSMPSGAEPVPDGPSDEEDVIMEQVFDEDDAELSPEAMAAAV
ncbi:MAG: single-stranded DNA-binding protein [Propionibacteriaceae bacterium]|nr:single-stranded DNA-binding protein [Propionibacteriaceae bacterium]